MSGADSTAGALLPYLGEAWLAAADAALSSLEPLDADVRVGFVVTGGPSGRSTHQLVLGPRRVGVEPGVAGAAVTMTMAWEAAVAIAQGAASAPRAFLDGRLQVSGDLDALLGHQTSLAEIDDRLASLRSRTAF